MRDELFHFAQHFGKHKGICACVLRFVLVCESEA